MKSNLPVDPVTGKVRPGPGRPQGSKSARGQLVEKLDRMLQKKENISALIDGLEQTLQDDPAKFFKQIVMPLLPRETKILKDTQITHEIGDVASALLGAIQKDKDKAGSEEPNIIDADADAIIRDGN